MEVAEVWRCIRVRWCNLTLMPTHKVSRFKHRSPEMVEVIGKRDPVATWPNELLGTYYEVLGVGSQAEAAVIKDAYNKISVMLHPDKNPGHVTKATALFKQVNEAYRCLRDEESRRAYDIQQRIARRGWTMGPTFGREGRENPFSPRPGRST